MLDNLTPAIVHEPLTQKLSVFKFRTEWLIVDIPAGIVVSKCQTWAEALEHAQTILDVREVCS